MTALLEAHYDETNSYLELTRRIGNIKAVCSVTATANGANAISLIIPCYRIIGSRGDLLGYSGGLPLNKRLLNLERSAQLKSVSADILP
ncbi:MAG: methylated-DNA--[protein]-cysteine S-methyltransferase [Proteobacteria bacterium]|nr:methylated-DNA--[protein]-cysteine S-methyltransferase [Pseudomonadota bacterium]